MEKKTLGIIGGMGSMATTYFFDKIIKEMPCKDDRDYLEIFVHNNSKIPDRSEAILYRKESPVKEMLRSAMIFDSLKVDYIVMICVTAHYFADEIQRKLKYSKLINILSTTAQYIHTKLNDIKKVGVLASTGTIKTGLWQNELSKYSIKTVQLSEEDQEKYVMETIYKPDGLKYGDLGDHNRNNILHAVKLLAGQGCQAIVAGCSEIPMIIGAKDIDIAFIDAFKILRENIYSKCYI